MHIHASQRMNTFHFSYSASFILAATSRQNVSLAISLTSWLPWNLIQGSKVMFLGRNALVGHWLYGGVDHSIELSFEMVWNT